ncbi:hypothetical protein BCR39DRAFT_552424 [Naematelia encephala]|uniref:Uncharacterized protein n=1 Tax=Naematelia encephala TaxID=71784 RepID=A0A1Y2AHQ8_9TREE|nr:hypothetical protein BCR39DRAFT_552424 [Naematelia encephala]
MQPDAKPTMSDKLTGKFKVLVGKTTHDPNRIIEGTAKETGQAQAINIPIREISNSNSHQNTNGQDSEEEDEGNYKDGEGDGEENKLETQISPPAGMAGSYEREKSLKKEQSKLDGDAFECANGLKKDGKYEV